MSEPTIMPAERASAELPVAPVTDEGLGNTSWILDFAPDSNQLEVGRWRIRALATSEHLTTSPHGLDGRGTGRVLGTDHSLPR